MPQTDGNENAESALMTMRDQCGMLYISLPGGLTWSAFGDQGMLSYSMQGGAHERGLFIPERKKKESSQIPTSEPIGKNAPEERQASDKPTPVFEAPDSWSLLTGCFDPHSINDQ